MAIFDFGAFPTLRTARLDLVELDAKFVNDVFVVRGDPIVQLYNAAPDRTREETLRAIAEQLAKVSQAGKPPWLHP